MIKLAYPTTTAFAGTTLSWGPPDCGCRKPTCQICHECPKGQERQAQCGGCGRFGCVECIARFHPTGCGLEEYDY